MWYKSIYVTVSSLLLVCAGIFAGISPADAASQPLLQKHSPFADQQSISIDYSYHKVAGVANVEVSLKHHLHNGCSQRRARKSLQEGHHHHQCMANKKAHKFHSSHHR